MGGITGIIVDLIRSAIRGEAEVLPDYPGWFEHTNTGFWVTISNNRLCIENNENGFNYISRVKLADGREASFEHWLYDRQTPVKYLTVQEATEFQNILEDL